MMTRQSLKMLGAPRRWIQAARTQLCSQVANKTLNCSINILGEIVGGYQCRANLLRCHRCVHLKIFGVFPFEELDAVLCVRLAAKVAVGSCHLVFGFPESQALSNGAWPAIKLDLKHVGNVIRCKMTALCSVCLDEQRQRL